MVKDRPKMDAKDLKHPKRELQLNVRISKDGRQLLEKLAFRLGLTMTSVLELAVRDLAAKYQLWGDGEGRRP